MASSPSGTRVFEAPAQLRYPGKEPSAAVVNLRRRGRRDRLAAVARTWAISWLAAVAAVFLPVLHFILVPALLIGGPLYALSMRDEHTTLLLFGDAKATVTELLESLPAGAASGAARAS